MPARAAFPRTNALAKWFYVVGARNLKLPMRRNISWTGMAAVGHRRSHKNRSGEIIARDPSNPASPQGSHRWGPAQCLKTADPFPRVLHDPKLRITPRNEIDRRSFLAAWPGNVNVPAMFRLLNGKGRHFTGNVLPVMRFQLMQKHLLPIRTRPREQRPSFALVPPAPTKRLCRTRQAFWRSGYGRFVLHKSVTGPIRSAGRGSEEIAQTP